MHAIFSYHLNIKIFYFSTFQYKDTEDSQYVDTSTFSHQPVLTFHYDPYVESGSTSNSLPDIVINGVLSGIYKSWEAYLKLHIVISPMKSIKNTIFYGKFQLSIINRIKIKEAVFIHYFYLTKDKTVGVCR